MKKLNFNTPFVQKFGLPIGLVAILVILQLFNLDTPLLSWQNISNIFMQNTAIALVALGVSFIMISGEGDMSFSGMFSLLTAVFAVVANKTDNYFAALLQCLLLQPQ